MTKHQSDRHDDGQPTTLSTSWDLPAKTELFVTALAARVLSLRGLGLEQDVLVDENVSVVPAPGQFFLVPLTAEVSTAAYLAFGIAVSSYIHRRRAHDPYRLPILLCAPAVTALAALVTHTSRTLVLLVILPWATLGAMMASSLAHALWRRLALGPTNAWP